MKKRNPNFFKQPASGAMATNVTSSLKRGQQTGSVNLANRNLTKLPDELSNFSQLTLLDNWWEAYPLLKLDASNNQIQQIPEQLASQEEIEYIKLMNNQITHLPSTIFSLKKLKFLDVSSNKLASIPEIIAECQTLVEVHFENNELAFLPEGLGHLINLEVVNFSNNKIQQIPNTFINLDKLKKIDLSSNNIKTIPDSIGGMELLEDLILSKNLIQDIQDNGLELLQNLVLLDLTQNKLKKFNHTPKSLKLDSIILAYNQISQMANLENAPNLSVLGITNISNNKIQQLPMTIIKMKNLKTLNVTNNSLSDLPPELSLLDNLVRISLEGNPLKALKPTMRSAGAVELKKYLKMKMTVDVEQQEYQDQMTKQSNSGSSFWDMLLREFMQGPRLIVNNKNIQELHPTVFQQEALTNLDFSRNELTYIPDDIRKLTNLKSIIFSKNKLTAVSPRIATLEYLQYLEMESNSLSQFLYNIGPADIHLDNLSYLNISNNNFKKIPNSIKYLRNLKNLLMANNLIKSIRNICRTEYDGLLVLEVSSNKIEEIPNSFAHYLKNIEFLNISNNNIQKIPNNIGLLVKIKTLMIHGNPLKMIRTAIIDKGPTAILSYLKNRYNESVDGIIEEVIPDSDEEFQIQPKQPHQSYSHPTHQHQLNQPPQAQPYSNQYYNEPQPMYSNYQPYSQPPSSQMNYHPGEEEKQPPPQNVVPQVNQQEDIQKKLRGIKMQIAALNKEIEENFNMPTYVKNQKKRELMKLISEQSNLSKKL